MNKPTKEYLDLLVSVYVSKYTKLGLSFGLSMEDAQSMAFQATKLALDLSQDINHSDEDGGGTEDNG